MPRPEVRSLLGPRWPVGAGQAAADLRPRSALRRLNNPLGARASGPAGACFRELFPVWLGTVRLMRTPVPALPRDALRLLSQQALAGFAFCHDPLRGCRPSRDRLVSSHLTHYSESRSQTSHWPLNADSPTRATVRSAIGRSLSRTDGGLVVRLLRLPHPPLRPRPLVCWGFSPNREWRGFPLVTVRSRCHLLSLDLLALPPHQALFDASVVGFPCPAVLAVRHAP
jgi:hypothetical protein